MKPVIIFGTEEFAECVYFYLMNDSMHKITAFTADRDKIKSDTFMGLPVIPFDEVQEMFPPIRFNMFIAIGCQKLNGIRTQKYTEAKEKGYRLISYICSKSTVWNDLQLGDNCFIGENNSIQPYVSIGNNVIISNGNVIAHGVHILENCFISSATVISEDSSIGENCFIGVHSTIKEDVKVAKNCIIGANSYITRDTRENEVFTSNSTKPNRISNSVSQYINALRQS